MAGFFVSDAQIAKFEAKRYANNEEIEKNYKQTELNYQETVQNYQKIVKITKR